MVSELLKRSSSIITTKNVIQKSGNINDWTFIKGFPSSSAGLNDFYLVKNNSVSGFMKTHLDTVKLPGKKYPLYSHIRMDIEQAIYTLTNNFVIGGMSPNFTLMYDSGHRIPFKDMNKFITDGKINIEAEFLRNYTYLFCRSTGRPSINTKGGVGVTDFCKNVFADKSYVRLNNNIYQIRMDFLKPVAKIEGTPSTGEIKKYLDSALKTDIDYGYIVLENMETAKLNFTKMSSKEFWSYVYSMVYSIALLAKYGVSHNDLHLGNTAMATRRPNELKKMLYEYKGKKVLVENYDNVIPRIFDYDRSAIYDMPNTDVRKFQEFSSPRDLMMFYCSLMASAPSAYKNDITKMFLNTPDMGGKIIKDGTGNAYTVGGIETAYKAFNNLPYMNDYDTVIKGLSGKLTSGKDAVDIFEKQTSDKNMLKINVFTTSVSINKS